MSCKVEKDYRYTNAHEWIQVADGRATTGITDYAQDQLSDVVYVELPEVGDAFEKGETYGVVESVKAASDVYLPIDGEISEVNAELESVPQLVNENPYAGGWFVRFVPSALSQLDELMDADEYAAFCEEEAGKGES